MGNDGRNTEGGGRPGLEEAMDLLMGSMTGIVMYTLGAGASEKEMTDSERKALARYGMNPEASSRLDVLACMAAESNEEEWSTPVKARYRMVLMVFQELAEVFMESGDAYGILKRICEERNAILTEWMESEEAEV